MFKTFVMAALAAGLTATHAQADIVAIASGRYKAISVVGKSSAAARQKVRTDCKKLNKGDQCAWSLSSDTNFLAVVECPVKVGKELEYVQWGYFSTKSLADAKRSALKKLTDRVGGNGYTVVTAKCVDAILYDGKKVRNFRK
jgi:hypothetical protein